MPKLREISGKSAVKILCNKFGFQISGHSGSHVRLSKMRPEGKIGTVDARRIKNRNASGILKLAKIDPDNFSKYL